MIYRDLRNKNSKVSVQVTSIVLWNSLNWMERLLDLLMCVVAQGWIASAVQNLKYEYKLKLQALGLYFYNTYLPSNAIYNVDSHYVLM